MEIARIKQLKLPVTDLRGSARWYAALLDLENVMEFVEDGVLRGLVLSRRDGAFVIALRERSACASTPVLEGHDIAAFEVSREAIEELADRCDRLEVRRGELHDREEFGVALDVHDPDGTVLRFLAGQHVGGVGQFVGLAFSEDGPPTRYAEPRLEL